MAGITTQLDRMRNEISDFKTWARTMIDAQQKQIVELEERLSRYDTPSSSPGKKTSETRPPFPIPDRPDVMEVANVGRSPRP